MNAKELIKELKEAIASDNGLHEFLEIETLDKEDLNGDGDEVYADLVPFEQVEYDRARAGYDMPDDVRYVYHFKKYNIYLAIDGTYSSWVGSEFDENSWYEVKPETVSVVRYKKVK